MEYIGRPRADCGCLAVATLRALPVSARQLATGLDHRLPRIRTFFASEQQVVRVDDLNTDLGQLPFRASSRPQPLGLDAHGSPFNLGRSKTW